MILSLALLGIAATAAAAAEAAGGGDAIPSQLADTDVRRRLGYESYEKIVGYGPSSQVTDQCAVDRDQAAMEAQLAIKTAGSFANAHKIYSKGGNSESYARVLLLWPGGLMADLKEGDYVLGKNEAGEAVAGVAYEDYVKGDMVIKVRYWTSNDQATYVGCQVGALVETNTKHCFTGEGDMEIGGQMYPYTYIPARDNRNGRTIAGFSEGIKPGDLIHSNEDFRHFSDYYGTDDYAHQFIYAAFTGKSTQFPNGDKGSSPFANGNADFSRYGLVGREQFIKRATVCMNIFMSVVRQWEEALDDCEHGCINCNRGPAHSWDEGVCYYTGSIEGTDGRADGVLLHQLADDMCVHYKTCGVEGKNQAGTAKVNYDLFGLFALGNFQILTGNCPATRAMTGEIVGKMYVPLIQGAVMSAHGVDKLGGGEGGPCDGIFGPVPCGERERAEGAAFAAAVLPRVHASSPKAARVIYENLKVGAPSTDAGAVKRAFESVYADIGISCEDVGGLWNEDEGEYYAGMEPCREETDGDRSLAIVLGSTFGALFAVAAAAAVYVYKTSAKRAGDATTKAAGGDEEATMATDSSASAPVKDCATSVPVDGLVLEVTN